MTHSSSDQSPTQQPAGAPPAAPAMRSPRAYAALLSAIIVLTSAWLYTTPTARIFGAKVASGVKAQVSDTIVRPFKRGSDTTTKAASGKSAKKSVSSSTTTHHSSATNASDASWEKSHSSGSSDTGSATDSGGGTGSNGSSGGGSSPKTPAPSASTPTPTPTTSAPTTSPTPKIEGCWSFTYQQDAQTYYDAHLDDPLGLDGAPGPGNGDGLACESLPVDPSRPTSVPVGGKQLVVPAKTTIADQTGAYFGVAEDGVPGDTKLLDELGAQAGKAPSMVSWYSNWDETYNVAKVTQSWTHGALPVITWMPAHKGNKNPADTSQQAVLAGNWDTYLTQYADAVAAAKMPIILRFAHEQNGNWYPWSASQTAAQAAQRGYTNTPQGYIDEWRHVWNIFQQEGANQYVMWAWTPNRVDTIIPKAGNGLTAIADTYPGDQYVDLVGMSAYAYKVENWSFDGTFGQTISQLQAVAPTKRILIAETGASENSGTVSNTDKKAAWITDTLQHVAADPRILGLIWFNNTVLDMHTVDGTAIVTDNKWDSSTASLTALQDGIAESRFLAGTSADDLSKITSVGDNRKVKVRK